MLSGYVMTDSNIKTAVAAWLTDATAAESTYGHISSWDTSGVTDMSWLFCGDAMERVGYCNIGAFREDLQRGHRRAGWASGAGGRRRRDDELDVLLRRCL